MVDQLVNQRAEIWRFYECQRYAKLGQIFAQVIYGAIGELGAIGRMVMVLPLPGRNTVDRGNTVVICAGVK